MSINKHINRENQDSVSIFDDRSLAKDYRTLFPVLKKGMSVLDVGCGTGALSKDIARIVDGNGGKVVGIDNTDKFIESGKQTYKSVTNLELICTDLFAYNPAVRFDLIVSARVLQWLSNPLEALAKMKSMLTPGGIISILDYNHTAISWSPMPPDSMQQYYNTFLKWRADAGMDNQIADHLPDLFAQVGLQSIEVINADEHYQKGDPNFGAKVGIWSKVAASKQMVEEGYISDQLRLKAIEEYNRWIEDSAVSMTMKLNEVRGCV